MSYTPPQTTGNATSSTPGIIQLAGDVGGTATAPQVTATHLASPLSQAQGGSGNTTGTATLNAPARITTATFATSLTPNAATTDIYRVILTGNVTFSVPSSPTDGQRIEFHIIQDSVGSHTVAFGTGYVFATSLALPTLSTAANATDVLVFKYSATASAWRFFGAVTGF